jgi:hypothetical protein
MNLKFPHDFSYQSCPPQGYSYQIESFKRNLLAIWICNHGKFSYTDKIPKSIWGFYDTKKKCYYAPINAAKSGDQVDIQDTTPYSAMQLKLNPLANVLYSTS